MKTYLVIATLSALSILNASAQDDAKLSRDVTYSTHNYKHPNKAAAARQLAAEKGVTVTAPRLNQGPAVSYKHQAPGATPVGGVVSPHTPGMDVALRNYKIQRVRESPTAPSEVGITTGEQQKQSVVGGN